MKEKKKKGSRFYRTAFIVTLALWIAGLLLTVLCGVLFSQYVYQLTGVSPEFKEPQYWQRFDKFYGEQVSDQKNRQSLLAYAALFNSYEIDYDMMLEDEEWEQNTGFAAFAEWMLFYGYHSCFCSVMTDMDGNILKGIDTMVVESSPCRTDKPGEVKDCKEQLLGLVDPDQVFTDEEFQKIVEFVHYDPQGMVVSDRYAIMGKENTVYVPLSISLIDSKGDEKLSLNLSRNEALVTQDQIREDRIYFHDVRSCFKQNKSYKLEMEGTMDEWIKSVPLDDASVKAAIQSTPFASKDSGFVTESKGYGLFHRDTAVYYGKNIRAFCYSETSMQTPFRRLILTFGGILSGIFLPFFAYFLVRFLQRKKEEAAAAGVAQPVKSDVNVKDGTRKSEDGTAARDDSIVKNEE